MARLATIVAPAYTFQPLLFHNLWLGTRQVPRSIHRVTVNLRMRWGAVEEGLSKPFILTWSHCALEGRPWEGPCLQICHHLWAPSPPFETALLSNPENLCSAKNLSVSQAI